MTVLAIGAAKPGRADMSDTGASDRDDGDDHIDSCLCGIVIAQSDVSIDSELPAAQGGVEAVGAPADFGDDIDGCDLEFSEADATTDAELPVAVGGVG
jgi:hypothetical protein